MKIKHFFVGAGLSLALALGVGAGLGASKLAAREVSADRDITVYYVVPAATVGSYTVKVNACVKYNNDSDQKWSTENMVDTGKTFETNPIYSGVIHDMYNGARTIQFQLYDGETWKSQVIPFENDWKSSTVYENKMWIHETSQWHDYEVDGATMRKVSKYKVIDGAAPVLIVADDVEDGTEYAKPADRIEETYHFLGWFTNPECTTPFTGTTISGDLNIYASYTSTFVNDSYIYYVTGSADPTTNYIVSFGGERQFGQNTGKAITSITGVEEVHGVVNFQGTEQLIYKIPYSTSAGDTHIIINKNAWGKYENQTADLLLVSHSAYWWSEDDNYHNDDAGAALDFILALEEKRNDVTAAGDIKSKSICGITAEDAATLCGLYNGLTSTQRTTYVDNSNVWTYKRTDSSQYDNVSIYDIMEELASKANIVLNGHSAKTALFGLDNNATTITPIVIVLVSAIALVTIGGIFVIRRRKEQE